MRKLISIVIVGCLLLASCAGVSKLPSVCDSITTPSELCALSNQMGVRIEDVGNALIITNAIAIGQKWYTRQEAVEVLREIRAILDDPVSYAVFTAQVYLKVESYPGLLEVATSYFSILGANPNIIQVADQDMLKGFLDNQIAILER